MPVAASIVCHGSRNLLAKRADGASGPVFVALWSAVAAVLWAPLGVWVLVGAWSRLNLLMAGYFAAALLIHSGYFLFLQRGYQIGGLSVVYPRRGALARVARSSFSGGAPARCWPASRRSRSCTNSPACSGGPGSSRFRSAWPCSACVVPRA